MDFPSSRLDCSMLADDLVAFLRNNLGETRTRPDWTAQVFRTLDRFAAERGLDSFHRCGPSNRREFLWDWTAFEASHGLVIACESEWLLDTAHDRRDPKHDLEKLFVACCPVKLFVFWGDEENAEKAQKALTKYCASNYGRFQSGSVFVLYCIDPATVIGGDNNDHVWQFQAKGEFAMSREQFDLKPVPVSAK